MGFKKIKGFSKFMGMPCDKLKKEIMVLSVSIQASRIKDSVSSGSPSSTYKLTPKGSKDLKRLVCSINYIARDVVSKSSGRRGWVFSVSF